MRLKARIDPYNFINRVGCIPRSAEDHEFGRYAGYSVACTANQNGGINRSVGEVSWY